MDGSIGKGILMPIRDEMRQVGFVDIDAANRNAGTGIERLSTVPDLSPPTTRITGFA
jgi:hypothetical protein